VLAAHGTQCKVLPVIFQGISPRSNSSVVRVIPPTGNCPCPQPLHAQSWEDLIRTTLIKDQEAETVTIQSSTVPRTGSSGMVPSTVSSGTCHGIRVGVPNTRPSDTFLSARVGVPHTLSSGTSHGIHVGVPDTVALRMPQYCA